MTSFATPPDPDFLSLLFSPAGAAICVCVTIIFVAAIVFLLSRRFPQITLQYKDSKIELRRQDAHTETDEESATVSPSQSSSLASKESAGALGAPGSAEKPPSTIFDLFKAVERQDRGAIEKIFKDFETTPPFGGDLPYELTVWRNLQLLEAGFDDARTELERIERERPQDSDASRALARYYLGISAHAEAAPHIEILLSRAGPEDDRLTTAILLKAELIESTEGLAGAANFLLGEAQKVKDTESQSKIYAALGGVYSKDKKQGPAFAAYEVALKLDVHNKGARFSLAHLYSEIDGLQALSIRHYRILVQQDRSYWSAQNNLGVQYEQLGLHVHKVETWKAANERNEGYPLGNLMFAYLEAGFIEDAKRLYDSAASYARSSKRAVAARSRLERVRDEEEEKLVSIGANAEEIWRELTKLSFHFDQSIQSWIGEWIEIAGSSTLKITMSGEFVRIEQQDGTIVRSGYSKVSAGIAIVSVSEEDKAPKGLAALSLLGSYSTGPGHFIVSRTETKLRVLHISDGKMRSARLYKTNEATPASS